MEVKSLKNSAQKVLDALVEVSDHFCPGFYEDQINEFKAVLVQEDYVTDPKTFDLLKEAAELFRFYETSHRAKGAGHEEKVLRNADIAKRIESHIEIYGSHETLAQDSTEIKHPVLTDGRRYDSSNILSPEEELDSLYESLVIAAHPNDEFLYINAWLNTAHELKDEGPLANRMANRLLFLSENFPTPTISEALRTFNENGDISSTNNIEDTMFDKWLKHTAPMPEDEKVDEERANFEKFVLNCPSGSFNISRKCEGYWSSQTQNMWETWSARAAIVKQPLTKPVIEGEYHTQIRAADEQPRLATFDAFISGVRFAECTHKIGGVV